jgi:NAD(P)-dependent dehydrogenase (short-subunit alcohol dehydrogenase family)
MTPYKTALITGASSGLGRALAEALAAPGVTLHLGGRDLPRLEATAAAVRAKGAIARPYALDITSAPDTRAWIEHAGPLSLVIANAGISGGTGQGQAETEPQTRAIFAANLDGALNTILPALDLMATQPPGPDHRRGTIAAIASVAGFLPTPGAPAYGASKAALDAWTRATAPAASARGIHLISICPGFIRTPMTAPNPYKMPGLMDASEAAARILAALPTNRTRLTFPWWMGAIARTIALLPNAPALMSRAGSKPGLPPQP